MVQSLSSLHAVHTLRNHSGVVYHPCRHNAVVQLTVLTQYHRPHLEPLEHSLYR
jgi:hypothetical protein